MEFLAHRGLWVNRDERNTLKALCMGLDKGFGLEIDIRDLNGQLVISHDMPTLDLSTPLHLLLAYYRDNNFASTLALNIKADGLQIELVKLLNDYDIKNYFVFDMSVPDTLGYLNHGIRTFVRQSDLESCPALELLAQGVWMDELCKLWIDKSTIIERAANLEAFCIVSSELHGREYMSQWTQIRSALSTKGVSEKLMLCSDFPEEAERFFK